MKSKTDLLKLYFLSFIDFKKNSDNEYIISNRYRDEILKIEDLTEKFLSIYPQYRQNEILLTTFEAEENSFFAIGETFKLDILIDKNYIFSLYVNFYYNLFDIGIYDIRNETMMRTLFETTKISITKKSTYLCIELINHLFDFAMSNNKNRIKYLLDPIPKQKILKSMNRKIETFKINNLQKNKN